MMWQSFSNFSSWMTIGAWLAFLAIAVFGICAILTLPPIAKRLTKSNGPSIASRNVLVDVFSVVGILLSLGVAAYTGILLSAAPGIPFWDSWLLPCLFTASALDTGVALVEIIALTQSKAEPLKGRGRHFLEASVIVLVILESLALIGFLITMGDSFWRRSGPGRSLFPGPTAQ